MKKAVLKKLVCVMVGVMALLLFVGCGGNDAPAPVEVDEDEVVVEEPVAEEVEEPAQEVPAGERSTVTFAMWDEVQYPVFQEIVAVFEAENPDVEVVIELTPWSQYWINLDAAIVAGTGPDVFWMNSFLPRYALAGVIQPLDDLIARDGFDLSLYVEKIVDFGNWDGIQYTLPKGVDTVQVVYNRTIFEEHGVETPQAGWTWDDMRDIAADLRDAMEAADSGEFPIVMELNAQPSFINFIYQSGGFVLSEDGLSAGFDQPGTLAAYESMVALIEDGLMPSAAVLSDTTATELFASELGAILFVGSWNLPVINDVSFAANVGTVAMPAREQGNMSVLGGLGFAMNSNADDQEAAWRLIQFLAGDVSNRMQAEAGIDVPALLSAQHYYHLEFIDTSVIFEATTTGFSFPTSPSLAEWFSTMNEISMQIFAGEFTPEEGTGMIQDAIQTALDAME
jgi:multiple sugar transport system substrate-binding protein